MFKNYTQINIICIFYSAIVSSHVQISSSTTIPQTSFLGGENPLLWTSMWGFQTVGFLPDLATQFRIHLHLLPVSHNTLLRPIEGWRLSACVKLVAPNASVVFVRNDLKLTMSDTPPNDGENASNRLDLAEIQKAFGSSSTTVRIAQLHSIRDSIDRKGICGTNKRRKPHANGECYRIRTQGLDTYPAAPVRYPCVLPRPRI